MDLTTTLTVVGLTEAVKRIVGDRVSGWVTVAVAAVAGMLLATLEYSALPSFLGLVRGALNGILAVGGVTLVDRAAKAIRG